LKDEKNEEPINFEAEIDKLRKDLQVELEEKHENFLVPETPSTRGDYVFQFKHSPPTTERLLTTLKNYGISKIIHPEPHFTKEQDLPEQPFVFGGSSHQLKTKGTKFLSQFDPFENEKSEVKRSPYFIGLDQMKDLKSYSKPTFRVFCPVKTPPSHDKVTSWLNNVYNQSGIHAFDSGYYLFNQFFFLFLLII